MPDDQMSALAEVVCSIVSGRVPAEDLGRHITDVLSAGIGRRDGDFVVFSAGDRLRCAMLALEGGAPIDEVSECLDWRDFEGLVAEILRDRDYAVTRNLMLASPRMEIDVAGRKGDTAVLVDCKHWHRSVPLASAVAKQVARARRYASKSPECRALPVIVTLYRQSVSYVRMVPVVSVEQFASFVDGLPGHMDEMRVIAAD